MNGEAAARPPCMFTTPTTKPGTYSKANSHSAMRTEPKSPVLEAPYSCPPVCTPHLQRRSGRSLSDCHHPKDRSVDISTSGGPRSESSARNLPAIRLRIAGVKPRRPEMPFFRRHIFHIALDVRRCLGNNRVYNRCIGIAGKRDGTG